MAFLVLIVFLVCPIPQLTDRQPSSQFWLAGWPAVNPPIAELGTPEKPLKPIKPLVFNTFPMPEHKKLKKPLFFNVSGAAAFEKH